MDERKYSNIEDVIREQRQRCDLLRNAKEVVFGLDEENRALLTELHREMDSVSNGISHMKTVLTQMKNDNEKLQLAVSELQTVENFLDAIEDQPDFRRLFCTSDKESVLMPMSESRPSKKPVLTIPAITIAELENVPYYTKGRIKLEDINDFIYSLNATISKKYSIVRCRNTLKYEDKLLQYEYKQQERLCPGLTFFTEDDIKKFGFLRASVAVSKLLNILRVTHRVKEVRSDGFVRYVVADA